MTKWECAEWTKAYVVSSQLTRLVTTPLRVLLCLCSERVDGCVPTINNERLKKQRLKDKATFYEGRVAEV